MLIWQFFLWKSAIYHSIKLPFDAEVAEKILNVIYCAGGDGDSPNQVRLGDYDLQYFETGEQTLDISWIKLHENYNREIDGNDIAIIKLNRPVM